MLEEHLVQECTIIDPTRNEFGDYVGTTGTTEKCRFREISTMRRVTHGEVSDADAMLWLLPSTVATDQKIILFDGVHYQIERLTKARRLGEDTVQFVKCDLKVTDIAVS